MTDNKETTTKCKSPSAVANFLLEKAWKEKVNMTPMKLIKMIYIAYGWAISAKNIRLFDEDIEAWKYGPVIPSVYHEFKHFGSQAITDCLSLEYDPFHDQTAHAPKISPEDKDTLEVLEVVWDLYKDKNATTLMRLTHQPNTPWYNVWHKEQKKRCGIIDPQSIQKHYKTILNELAQEDEK